MQRRLRDSFWRWYGRMREFRREPQYTDVLSKMPLITVEKIGESDPFRSRRAIVFLSLVFAHWNGLQRNCRSCPREGIACTARRCQYLETARLEIEAFFWDVEVVDAFNDP